MRFREKPMPMAPRPQTLTRGKDALTVMAEKFEIRKKATEVVWLVLLKQLRKL